MVSIEFKTDAANNDIGWRLTWGLVRDGWRRSGILMSPNFPKPYPNRIWSDDIIRVSPYNTIKFNFTNFSTHSGQWTEDWVQIWEYISDNEGWPVWGRWGVGPWGGDVTPRLSGNSLPEGVSSPHHIARVRFVSDGLLVGAGWRLEWIEEGRPCNESRQLNPVAAFLSSEYVDPKNTSLSYNLGAEKCIDGITDGPDSGNPGDDLCHTSYPPPPDPERPWIHNYPWLAIDFGVEVFVKKVVLFNRRECCYSRTRNISIGISNCLPDSERNPPFWSKCGGSWIDSFAPSISDHPPNQQLRGPAGPGQQIEVENLRGFGYTRAGRYLVIQIEKAVEPLNLKEVVVYGYENSTEVKICEKPYL